MNVAGEVSRHCGSCTCPVSADTRDAAGRPIYRLDEQSGAPGLVPQVSFAYGGAGIVLSTGLLNKIDASDFEACARRAVCGSGDYRVGSCIRTVSGHGLGMLPEPASKTGELHRLGVEVAIAAKMAGMSATEQASYVARLTGLFGEREMGRAHRQLIVAALIARYGPVRGGNWPWAFHPVRSAAVAYAIVEAQRTKLWQTRRNPRVHANASLLLVANAVAEQVRRQEPPSLSTPARRRQAADVQLRGLVFPAQLLTA